MKNLIYSNTKLSDTYKFGERYVRLALEAQHHLPRSVFDLAVRQNAYGPVLSDWIDKQL